MQIGKKSKACPLSAILWNVCLFIRLVFVAPQPREGAIDTTPADTSSAVGSHDSGCGCGKVVMGVLKTKIKIKKQMMDGKCQ